LQELLTFGACLCFTGPTRGQDILHILSSKQTVEPLLIDTSSQDMLHEHLVNDLPSEQLLPSNIDLPTGYAASRKQANSKQMEEFVENRQEALTLILSSEV
jgi:hypothetical protein